MWTMLVIDIALVGVLVLEDVGLVGMIEDQVPQWFYITSLLVVTTAAKILRLVTYEPVGAGQFFQKLGKQMEKAAKKQANSKDENNEQDK